MADENLDQIIDMPEQSDMINDARTQARYAVEHFKVESQISNYIKKFFDEKYGPNWHCVVGKHFNSYSSYESKRYMFFYEGQMAILLYKMG
ncbi:unnamed protein product [Paramecium primaurelia]|uniref:Dynein light chain n=2 Tax=Paramecium TaxID=5884 RepID=A0A8S1YA43_9CILI|nr:unnamed protein product [Paramecium primaurelia]CAD8210283.1 unnamed protein product [Paramecium pentaurelia]